MKKYIKWIIIVIFTIVMIYIFISYLSILRHNLDKEIKNVNLKNVDNLMVVAHPDDETLWGGAHLNDDSYLIVCITCGKNRIRYHEIKSVSKISNNRFIGLFYPDKTWFVRDDWKNYEKTISSDLKKIIMMKDWKTIVTHNKNGEYGHEQHKMTHRIVTDIYEDLNIENKTKLYYFGDYYSKNKIKLLEKDSYIMNSDNLKKKEKMIKKYRSQYFTTKKFKHMNKHENFIEYNSSTK